MRALGVLREVGAWPVRRWRYASVLLVVRVVAAGSWARVRCWRLPWQRWPSRRWWSRRGRAVAGSFELVVAGPYRRWSWRRWARRNWESLARDCDLAALRREPWDRPRDSQGSRSTPCAQAVGGSSAGRGEHGWGCADVDDPGPPWADRGRAGGGGAGHRGGCGRGVVPGPLGLAVGGRAGAGAARHPGIASARDDARRRRASGVDEVVVGRRQDGSPWALPLRGRHTLVVGCSGAGKGSILWGVAAGLGPAVAADVVRLWGIDLKRGVELGIGQGLFHATAYTPAAAMGLLGELLTVIDARGGELVGRSRLHEPSPGDPLHVLVIDELAALIAYADPDTRRDAGRLLSEVLTQGRALGVVVVAMVQDPRKETVGQRGLFTQTVALRLRSAEETRMVLGDGMAAGGAGASDQPGRARHRVCGRG